MKPMQYAEIHALRFIYMKRRLVVQNLKMAWS